MNGRLTSAFREYTDLSENQFRMVIIWFISFLVQSTVLYLMFPDKFDTKWFFMAMTLNIMYNISFFKLFSE